MSADAAPITVREILPPDTALAAAALRALRTDWEGEGALARHVDEVLRPGGYRLAGAFEDGHEAAGSVAGFRLDDNLAWGHHLYIDDLATVPERRGRGLAGALLRYVCSEAEDAGCAEVHLDSGVGLERADAHRFYLNAGFVISAHHFAHRLG